MTAIVPSHASRPLSTGGREALLQVRDLRVMFQPVSGGPATIAVDGVAFDVHRGETVGLVGESGCGKSVTSLAIMGLLDHTAKTTGSARFQGQELLTLSDRRRANLLGKDMAMVFQDPLSSLNPVVTVGLQITEVLKRHRGLKGPAANNEAARLLSEVGVPDPSRRLGEYPHQQSGGIRQRCLIAIALACEPRLLIADEPTTALDVTIQAQILELLKDLVDARDTALIMITHDLGVVAGLCDRVNVMYAGRVVERARCENLFAKPLHPYTEGLLASVPRIDNFGEERLVPIPGSVADNIEWSQGCAFAPRCPKGEDACLDAPLTLSLSGQDGTPFYGDDAQVQVVRCIHPGERIPKGQHAAVEEVQDILPVHPRSGEGSRA